MSRHIDVRPWLEPDGWCARWLDFCEPFEAPESFSLFSILGCASAAVNRRIRVNYGFKPCVYTNDYIALFAAAGMRKSDTLIEAERLYQDAIPEAPDLPDDFSMSGFLEELAEKSKEKNGEKASGLIIGHELSDILGGAEYRQENSRILTKLWDCPAYYRRRLRMYGNEIIRHAYISMVAVSSHVWMEQLDPSTLDGGILRRILCVNEHEMRHDAASPEVSEKMRLPLVKKFRSRLRPGAFSPIEMQLTKKAKELNEHWYMTFVVPMRRGRSEREASFINSMQAHAFKIGAVMHVLEDGDPKEMDETALQRGQGLVMSLVPGTFELYASLTGTPFAKLRSATLRTLRANSAGMTPAALDRAVRASTGVRPRDLIDVVESLATDGLIQRKGGLVMIKEDAK